MTARAAPRVVLKSRRALPFIYRHPWVFSGAIGRVDGDCENGGVVDVVGDRGDFIGRGLYSKRSQITVRLLSWRADEVIDDAFFRRKVAQAVAIRQRLVPLTDAQTARRLVFSEADGLPGLIVDQYSDWLVTQFLSVGLDLRRDLLLDALDAELRPTGIFDRSDTDAREKEGLEKRSGTLRGAEPPEGTPIRDGGIAFEVDLRTGQKTGHYLDQRDNRLAAASFARGRRVLDAFCYSGGFGIAASLRGADHVVCVDSSEPALALARRNAELNGRANIEFARADAASFIRSQPPASFGLVVVDPPPLAKSSRDLDPALAAYAELYTAAMNALEPDGILVACCCSHHVGPEHVVRALNAAAVNIGAHVRIIETRGQPPDHPVAANCPETAYLKCFICHVGR